MLIMGGKGSYGLSILLILLNAGGVLLSFMAIYLKRIFVKCLVKKSGPQKFVSTKLKNNGGDTIEAPREIPQSTADLMPNQEPI
jgi:hypothetical protein